MIDWSPSALSIADRVDGAEGRSVASYVHFDPAWTVHRDGDNTFVLDQHGARAVVRIAGAPNATLHSGDRVPLCGWRARGFNDVVPSFSLRLWSPSYSGEEWRMIISRE